jgi:hypothetical protein
MTNTPIISHNVRVELDNELGAQVDISGNANNVSIKPSLRVGTYQTFGNGWDKKIDGGRGWSASVQFFYSRTDGEAFRDIVVDWQENRGARTLTVSSPDASTGSDEWSGEVVIEGDVDLGFDRTSDDPVMVEIPMGGHGQLYYAVIV